jgi:hypothetical protein
MNRKERRAARSARRSSMGKLKLRCVCCDRVGKTMTKEHVWPKWLIKYANLKEEGVAWHDGKMVNPNAATIPMCADCNHELGAKLEGRVSELFETMENGHGLTDTEAELLVRWLWKFEGLFWNAAHLSHPTARYSALYTVRERVLGTISIRPMLSLAISFVERNDDGFNDWPVGIDSGIWPTNSIFVSGVFVRTALMVLLTEFVHLVPPQFGIYPFPPADKLTADKVFFPPTGFATANEAIFATKVASGLIGSAHEQRAREWDARPTFVMPGRRVEIP